MINEPVINIHLFIETPGYSDHPILSSALKYKMNNQRLFLIMVDKSIFLFIRTNRPKPINTTKTYLEMGFPSIYASAISNESYALLEGNITPSRVVVVKVNQMRGTHSQKENEGNSL